MFTRSEGLCLHSVYDSESNTSSGLQNTSTDADVFLNIICLH
jgi:hypothetical protein